MTCLENCLPQSEPSSGYYLQEGKKCFCVQKPGQKCQIPIEGEMRHLPTSDHSFIITWRNGLYGTIQSACLNPTNGVSLQEDSDSASEDHGTFINFNHE